MSGSPFTDQMTDHEILRDLYQGFVDRGRRIDQMDTRLTALEKFKWTAVGGLAVLVLLIVPVFIDVVLVRGSS